jgi:glutamate-ammonia-ligase adenylyltransferase
MAFFWFNTFMHSDFWKTAVAASADPARAQRFVEPLSKTPASASILEAATPEQARVLCALLAGSQASATLLVAHPEWLEGLMAPGALEFPRTEQGLRREAAEQMEPLLQTGDYSQALGTLRTFKQREMVRIAARDLARLGTTDQIVREITNVADLCTDWVFRVCWRQLTERFGRPFHTGTGGRWEETRFCVIGLGKMGGQELNYSSDIDVVFVYSEEGYTFKTTPKTGSESGHGLGNHAFFLKLSEALIGEISRLAPEGSLFRIDLRLRPEGNAGPLCRSIESYENYYAQWGQTWERMMLIKARLVAGDRELGAEFIEMVHPFRYPRSLGERTLGEIAAMKQRIENEVVRAGELDRNVKLGRGGIREIEFVAQTLQLLHAGHLPFLQNHQTIPVLHKAVHYHLLTPEDVKGLHEAYYFLRDVEHRLQMDDGQQTHTIPTSPEARERLARLMGFSDWDTFESARASHCRHVRMIYERLIPADEAPAQKLLPNYFDTEQDQWKALLARHSFRDVEQAFRMVATFVEGPGYVHVAPRTVELARDLLPRFLALCPKKGEPVTKPVLSDPDRVLVRLDSFVSAYGARATLYELWAQRPTLFELLLWLFDRSEFLAETAIRTPDMVDDLELSGRMRRPKAAVDILRDLRFGRNDEDQRLWIRRYHQTELMRIGLRDILGLADFMQSLVEISALADACLQYALEVVMRRHRLKTPPFCIIGLGKLGGREINYGSDLDILFVTRAATQKLPSLQKLAIEVMDLLSVQTEQGIVFKTDARLRPDGAKGLIVNNLEACEDYYRNRASLWEIQTITRTRPIAGDMSLGTEFQSLASALANFTPENVAAGFPSHDAAGTPSRMTGLAAYAPEWQRQIARMRERIEKERTPAGKEALAIKTGAGGLIDAEFLAQTLCLANGWQEPNTTQALVRACESGVLSPGDGRTLLDHYSQLHRIECVLRRWSFEGEVLLPDDPAPLYRVAVRCGFQDASAFMEAVRTIRTRIREVYGRIMPQGTPPAGQ